MSEEVEAGGADRFWRVIGGVGVRTKIFGIVLGSSVLLSLTFASQGRASLLMMLEDEHVKQGDSIARDIAARAVDPILINDLYAVQELLTETQRNFPDAMYAFVIDPDGRVLAHTFGASFPVGLLSVNEASPDTFAHPVVISTGEEIVWDIAVPIFDGRLGTARVGMSDRNIRQNMTNLGSQLTLTLMAVMAVSLLAAGLLTWTLTRPILALVTATRALAAGDFSIRVSSWADDEIGELAQSFNQMTAELGRIDEIRREREELRRQLFEGVIRAQEEERGRISRELHDSTSQRLTSMMMGLLNLEEDCESQATRGQAYQLRTLARETLEEVHSLAWQIRPAVLDDHGLEPALERYLNEWSRMTGLEADLMVLLGEQRLAGPLETAFFRIIQEALTNVARHAEAESVSVLLEQRGNDVVTVIEDDGRGFNVDDPPSGTRLGLIGIEERAGLLGGESTVESRPGRGTTLFVRIPISADGRARP